MIEHFRDWHILVAARLVLAQHCLYNSFKTSRSHNVSLQTKSSIPGFVSRINSNQRLCKMAVKGVGPEIR